MRRLALILGLSLVVLATGAPVPAQAFPMRFAGGMGHGFAGGHGFGHSMAPPFVRQQFVRQPFIRQPFFRGRKFGRFAFVVPVPIGFWAWPPFYGYSSGYPPYDGSPAGYDPPYASPAAYDPPPVYTQPAVQEIPPVPPPPMPEVVEFSTGRYQLRGNGVGTGYSWVWIPNPPSAPPAELGADGPSSQPPPHARLYRWTDDQGVVHLTNLWQEVPPQYRPQVKPPQTS
jgi:hypothetical protein